ncbi:MAG: hypothetical protein KKD75_02820 [Nanoarchaeota archaeon]|nr:hypothetical protein [Nanoarchaeota archaeon]
MKFAKSKIDEQAYWQKICDLLRDENCYIFIDTNILSFIFKLYKDARVDLFDWFNSLQRNNRLKVPTWVLQEYNDKLLKGELGKFNQTRQQSETLTKNMEELKKGLHSYIDDFHLSQITPDNRDDYLTGVVKLINDLNIQLSALKNGQEKEKYLEIHQEIEENISSCILNSNIFTLILKAEQEAQNRYTNRMSPGFRDNNKSQNPYGDFIIWNEILVFCKEHTNESGEKPEKVLFISNDNKSDWVYLPNKKIDDKGRLVSNKNPCIYLANPDLMLEYQLKTDSDDFYILDIKQLVMALLKNNNNYQNLAKAIQIEFSVEEETEAEATEEVNQPEVIVGVSTPEIVIEVNQPEVILGVSTPEIAIEVNQPEVIVEVSTPEIAIEDTNVATIIGDYPISDSLYISFSDDIQDIIEKLKSLNWYKQNPAMIKIKSMDFEKENKNDLFVLGRNIYQTACGGESQAMLILDNFKSKMKAHSIEVQTHILNGILFEIYFNSDGNLREVLKVGYSKAVLNILTDKDTYKDSINFIQTILEPYRSSLLILPTENKVLNIEFIVLNIEDVYCIEDIIFKIDADKIDADSILQKIKNKFWLINGKSSFQQELIKTFGLLENQIHIESPINTFILCEDYCILHGIEQEDFL